MKTIKSTQRRLSSALRFSFSLWKLLFNSQDVFAAIRSRLITGMFNHEENFFQWSVEKRFNRGDIKLLLKGQGAGWKTTGKFKHLILDFHGER